MIIPMKSPLLLSAAIVLSLSAIESSAQQRNQGREKARRLMSGVNLKVGQMAPDFALKTKEQDKTVTLSSFRGKKPVVLVFGSYT